MSGMNSFATHIVGTDMYYTHISGNTYEITLVAYGDCGPASAGSFATFPFASPSVCIYNGATSVGSVSLLIQAPTTGTELPHVCPLDSSQCLNPASLIPGVKKFIYKANFF